MGARLQRLLVEAAGRSVEAAGRSAGPSLPASAWHDSARITPDRDDDPTATPTSQDDGPTITPADRDSGPAVAPADRDSGPAVAPADQDQGFTVAALLRDGAAPDLPDPDGTTPLYRASVQGLADNVRLLLEAGADANRESGTGDEGLPLCAAVCHDHDDVVEALIAAGADPDLREDGGTGLSASDWAARRRAERASG